MYSIVIPTYNEELKIIKETVNKCSFVMNQHKLKHEIILIDDGSITKVNFKFPSFKIIRHPHNAGYGRSIKSGILAAKFDSIIITDADGTYPIESIPTLINSYTKNKFDMVVGARQGEHYDESFKKKILRIILKFLVEYTAGRNIPDINSGLRIFSKEKTLSYFNYLCDTFSFTTSLTLAFMMNGLFVEYIPIKYSIRHGKSKVHLLRDSLRTLQFIVEAMVFYNPIKVFLALILSIIFLGSTLLLFLIISSSSSSIIYAILFIILLLSIIGFSFSLISIQLKQILSKSKKYDE
jgi:polyisoprenyl-phosphate glycosyltransferase